MEKDAFSSKNSAQKPLRDVPTEDLSNIPHEVSEDPPVQRSLRESNAEATEDQNAEALEVYLQEMQKCSGSVVTDTNEGSHSTNIGESGIGDGRNYEATQKIVDMAAGLPSRCSELLEALEDKSSASHAGNVSPVQRAQRDVMAEVIGDPEQRDISANDFQHSSQQIVDVAVDLLSRCFEFEALNLEREEGQKSSEGIGDRVDAAACLLNQYFESGSFSCEASNHETQRTSGPYGASEDPPVQRALKDTTAMGTEGFKERGIRDVPASSIEDVCYNKALQQIADVAADLLHECFELIDRTNQTQREKQGNSVPHGEQGGNGNTPARDTKIAKCHEALQHIADIGADVLYKCFVLLELQSSHQEKEENQLNSAPLKQTTEHYSSSR